MSTGEESGESSEEEGEASESEASASSDEEVVHKIKKSREQVKKKKTSEPIVDSDDEESADEKAASADDREVSADENASADDRMSGGEVVSGDERSGDERSGDERSGDERSGDERSGDEESGDEGSGAEVSADEASGDEASADEGSGDEASADDESGDEAKAKIKAPEVDPEKMEVDVEVVKEESGESSGESGEESEASDEDMKLEGLLKKEFGKDLPAARWTNLSPIFEINEASSEIPEVPKVTEAETTAEPKRRRRKSDYQALRHVDEAISSVIESARDTDESSTAVPESESDTAKEKSDTGRGRSDSDTRDWSYIVPAIVEHDYFCLPPSVRASQEDDSERTDSAHEEEAEEERDVVWIDHCYCLRAPDVGEKPKPSEMKPPPPPSVPVPPQSIIPSPPTQPTLPPPPDVHLMMEKPTKKRGRKPKLTDITNKIPVIPDNKVDKSDQVSREVLRLLPIEKPPVVKKFPPRVFKDERQIFYDIYGQGMDEEDIRFLKRSYDEFIQSQGDMIGWLNDILWIEHPVTNIPDPVVKPKRRRKNDDSTSAAHFSGSMRTEGYYKVSDREKMALSDPSAVARVPQKSFIYAANDLHKPKTAQSQSSREARSTNRRLQASFADLDTDLLRFNQLKFRKKNMKFAKSLIHDWGLFALEPIASDEMVIEYVGQKIRMSVADEREKQYEATGLGSSYMFRVDTEMVIDATKEGNLARFINHSCNPNCYAKVITIENSKKIVIYSKRDIDVNEEITYDYKFPLEDEAIPCLCGAVGCRGRLN